MTWKIHQTPTKHFQDFINWRPIFNTQRDLKNGKRYDTLAGNQLIEISSSEAIDFPNAHGDIVDSDSKARNITQEEFGEQNESYIAPVKKQLKELTRLIQGISNLYQTNVNPKASTSASSEAGKLSNTSNHINPIKNENNWYFFIILSHSSAKTSERHLLL